MVKLNAGLHRLPAFAAGARRGRTSGDDLDHAGARRGTGGRDAGRRGEPSIGFAELYFQTAYDASVAPPGRHTMSVFAQYAPYELAAG